MELKWLGIVCKSEEPVPHIVEPPKNHTELLIDSPLDFLTLYGPDIFVYLKFTFSFFQPIKLL